MVVSESFQIIMMITLPHFTFYNYLQKSIFCYGKGITGKVESNFSCIMNVLFSEEEVVLEMTLWVSPQLPFSHTLHILS